MICTPACQKYLVGSKKWSLNANNSPSKDRKNMKYISSESLWWDASNVGIFMRLGSIDEEINRKDQKRLFANNSPSNDARRIQILPFDASRHDESDDMCFISLWSVETGMRSNFTLQKLKIIYIYTYINILAQINFAM